MPSPLIHPLTLEQTWADPILAVAHSQPSVRIRELHAHTPGQLIGSLAGLLSVSTPQDTFVVPTTHAVWIPPNMPHGMRSHAVFQGWTVYVVEDRCKDLPTEPQILAVNPLLREAVLRTASLATAADSNRIHHLANVIVDELACAPAVPLGLRQPVDPRVRRITNAILEDLRDNRSMIAWAETAGISHRTLARKIVSETGLGFSEWRQRARALRAVELLADGLSVTTVAIDLGYDNVSAFIAMFRRTLGSTPGRYMSGLAQNCPKSV